MTELEDSYERLLVLYENAVLTELVLRERLRTMTEIVGRLMGLISRLWGNPAYGADTDLDAKVGAAQLRAVETIMDFERHPV